MERPKPQFSHITTSALVLHCRMFRCSHSTQLRVDQGYLRTTTMRDSGSLIWPRPIMKENNVALLNYGRGEEPHTVMATHRLLNRQASTQLPMYLSTTFKSPATNASRNHRSSNSLWKGFHQIPDGTNRPGNEPSMSKKRATKVSELMRPSPCSAHSPKY